MYVNLLALFGFALCENAGGRTSTREKIIGLFPVNECVICQIVRLILPSLSHLASFDKFDIFQSDLIEMQCIAHLGTKADLNY